MLYSTNMNRNNFYHRRSIRLKNYDYSKEGAYFLTICTKNKQCLFGDIKQDQMRLNYLGVIVFQCWQAIPEHFPHVALDTFVIMPNHLHGILWIIESPHQEDQYCEYRKAIKGSIPSIVRAFKAVVTKEINQICQQKGTSLIWQKNYYEQVIRNEKMLNNIREYIINNPVNWNQDSDYSASKEILLNLPF